MAHRDPPSRHDVFGTDVSLTTIPEVVGHLLDPPEEGLVVAIANVHSVMTARRQPALRRALATAGIVTPDGMPLVWALRAAGHDSAIRVTGIEVMTETLKRGGDTRHFFYGSTPEVLASIGSVAAESYPEARVAGMLSPPFRELDDTEKTDLVRQIRAAAPDVVWVGLGMPKQEHWMAYAHPLLPGVSLVGVGAAFDWLAGTTPIAPQWMRDRGLEWLYRLILEPRRMWRRYVYNNPAFLILLVGRYVRTAAGRLLRRRIS